MPETHHVNTQPFPQRSRAALAALLAFLLAVAGALTALPAHAADPVATATPTVSATAAPRAGGTITISGSGFAGTSPGIYLGVGPSGLAGFYPGATQITEVVWIAPGNADGSSAAGRTAPMTAEGTFTVQVGVPELTDGAQYAVYTSKAHGQGFSDPSQNTITAVAWEPLPAVTTTTTLTVDPAGSSPAGAGFTLGATVAPAASGTVEYFNGDTQLGSAAVGATLTSSIATAGVAQLKAVFTPADPAAFTGSTSAVVAYAITAAPVEPEPVGPTLLVSKTTGLDPDGETVTVTGTGYNPDQAIYLTTCTDIALAELSFGFISAGCTAGAKLVTSTPTTATQVKFAADGSFTTEFRVAPKGGSTAIYTLANHTAPGDRSQDAKVSVTFAEPAPVPVLSVSKTDGLNPAGETLTITAEDYDGSAASRYGGGKAGFYLQVGWLADTWRPSEGAVSADRSNAYSAWVADAANTLAPTKWTENGDGTVDVTWQATVTKAALDAKAFDGGTLAVFSVGAGGVTQAVNELAVPIAFAEPDPVPALDVTVTSASASAGATIAVVGSDLGDAAGAYAAVIEKGTESQITAAGGYTAFVMPFPSITDGSTTFTVIAPTAKLDRTKQYEVLVWRLHSNPTADNIYARADVLLSAGDWEKLFPGTLPPIDPNPPVTPTDPAVTPAQGAGSLSWEISSSFAQYVVGSTAKGSIAVTDGATRSGGLFQFGQATGSTYDTSTGTGTVTYAGSVRFTGHGGILDVTIANPQVRITSPDAATLSVTSAGMRVDFATLDLSAAVRVTANGTVTYSKAPAALTAAGRSQVFQGYTTALDPVTFTVGVAAAAPAGSTGTVASAAPASATRTTALPATPPAETGIDLDDDTLAALQKGEPVTVSVPGFMPDETGIKVVVYSTPTLLGEVSADASGTATWSGSLPAALADGDHTLTFQGSVDRGIRFTLARAAIAGGCFVEAASLDWGFKESFRTYLEGIAAGGWELTDVTYAYPEFAWSTGEGAVDADTLTGLVAYGGAIRFTGHQGALDTTLSNARVELAGDTGYLVFDVSGTTQDGAAVTAAGVRLAEFAVPDLAIGPEGLVLDALPATLTEAGAAAFGTYEAGEALDPVSAVLPVADDCAVAAPAVADEVPVAEAAEAEAVSAVPAAAPMWPWAVGGIVLVLAAGAVVWIVVARRRAATGGGTAG